MRNVKIEEYLSLNSLYETLVKALSENWESTRKGLRFSIQDEGEVLTAKVSYLMGCIEEELTLREKAEIYLKTGLFTDEVAHLPLSAFERFDA